MFRTRYRRIVFFGARILLSLAYWELLLPRLGLGKVVKRTRSERFRRIARSFRGLAVQMGGVLIKVGQFLSSRVDVLPIEVTDELSGLQDEVPPALFADIRRVAEAELGGTLEEKFQTFDPEPLAAASLGQVHRATLPGSMDPAALFTSAADQAPSPKVEVVVKILRPQIEQIIETDLAALRTVGAWIHRYPPVCRRINVPGLLSEFTRVLLQEVDYLAEGRNAETFAANFKNFPGIRVPKVYWSHTTRRTLTLENVLAIKITDYEAIEGASVDRKEVASRLLDTYLKQIFEDGFFHADPHPGNLFVQPQEGASWLLTFVDFGMVGQVPPNLRMGLREMVIGVGTQDVARVVRSYQMMDLLLPGADLKLIERAGARVFERYWGKNMNELTSVSYTEMNEFADEFRELLYDLPFQVPQNVIFLGRCVGILSGMCTGLDPEFNLWDHLAPFARKLIAQEARHAGENWLGELEKMARSLVAAPRRIDQVLALLEQSDLSIHTPDVAKEVQRLDTVLRRLIAAILFTGLLIGGIQMYLAANPVPAYILLAGALLSLFYTLFSRRV